MKKANNILLLAGICLHIINSLIIDIWKVIRNIHPDNNDIILYMVISILFSVIGTLLYIALPTVLLCLNLKNKHNKVFAIIIAALNVLVAIRSLIGPYILAVPQYLVISKLGLIDTYWCIWLLSLLPDFGVISLVSSVLIAVGAILSKENTKKKPEA